MSRQGGTDVRAHRGRMRRGVRAACAGCALAALLAAGAAARAAGSDTAADGAGASRATEPAPARKSRWNPFEGIEPSGRIPAPERPADMPNPERWRYIPEGRIKPGNIFQRFLVTSFIAPFVFQDKDTGTSFGLAVTDIDFRRQRRREFAGIFLSYSTEGQQQYGIVWQRWLHHREHEGGGVFQEERSRVRVRVDYEKTLTRRFYGFGAGTDESDETDYEDEIFTLDLGMEHAWPEPGDDLVLSGGLRIELHELGAGAESDQPDTRIIFPAIFADAEHRDLGWLYWGIRYDTRDSQVNPYRGWSLAALVEAALLQKDGDIGARYSFAAQRVFALPGLLHSGGTPGEENPPTDTLAVAARGWLSNGDLPFFERPALGGSRAMRGFVDGRFRDKAAWLAAIEYRFWVLPRGFRIPFTRALRVERVGLAPFYEAGSVAEDGASLFERQVHHSYGVGLRFTFERQVPFRVDFGFSREDFIVTAGFGLPF